MRFYFASRPERLGNMARHFYEPATGVASISFAGELNGEVKLSFASNIEAGELDVFVYDSKGNVVYKLGLNQICQKKAWLVFTCERPHK